MFDFELDWDTLFIYDGPDSNSPLIGGFTGDSLPGGGTITSSGGQITLRQYTDQGVTRPGFLLTWQCQFPTTPPVTGFSVSTQATCTGLVNFTDMSSNGPDSWFWDFGDGQTSVIQYPTHTYTSSGTYTVSLVSSNPYGSDTLTLTDYIVVTMPDPPSVSSNGRCGAGSVELSAFGNGILQWYDEPAGGSVLDTGAVFNTPSIAGPTTFYVSDNMINQSQYTGKADNAGGGGYFGNPSYIHYLVFDAFVPLQLVSVKVYANGDAMRDIALRDNSSNIIQQTSLFVPDGESRVYLNFDIPAGTDLQLVGLDSPDLYRNNAGVAFPYQIPGYISVNYSSASTAPYDYYYYFYDWEVKEAACSSARIPVQADALVIDAGLGGVVVETNQPDTVVLEAAAGFTSYLWQDGSTSSSLSVQDYGWYYVTVSMDSCIAIDSAQVAILTNVDQLYSENAEIEIFPNPNTGIFTLSCNTNTESDICIKIYSTQGQLIYTRILTGSESRTQMINMTDFAKGLYIVNITTAASAYTNKLIVE